MSVIHPGSSINFDVANLQQNDDEDEMLQEELRQQKELRELLAAELSDDLLDEEHSSVNDSNRSLPQDVSSERRSVDSPVITTATVVTQGWMQGMHVTQPVTSTPGDAPHNGYYGRQVNGYDYALQDQFGNKFAGSQEQYYDPSYGVGVGSQPHEWQHPQDYGNNMIYQQQKDNGAPQYGQNGVNPHHLSHGITDDMEYQFGEREVEGSEDYGEMIDGNHMQQQQQQYIQYKPPRNGVTTSSSSMTSSSGSKLPYRQSYPPQTRNYQGANDFENHTKGYRNKLDVATDCDGPVLDNFQHAFNEVTNDPSKDGSSRHMAQLQILYKARGKKIDKLNRELEELKSEGARDKRILNHQLAMAKDQKDGMGTSLEESQRLVLSKDREIEELMGKLEARSEEVKSLQSAKKELVTKIQVSERTIESLHEQLSQLNHSDAIERAREQHDAVMSATTQRHEIQILELTTQLDECREEMNEKGDEVEKLRFQLNKVSRESEQMLLDKTETINRLTKSLDDAQNQCQGLLAGSSENAFARHQLSDMMREKTRNEEEIAVLKMQMSEAEEHLKLYENALQLGAQGSKHPRHVRGGSLSDSLGELLSGGEDLARKLDWNTPALKVQDFEPGSQEELIDGLRKELQRALKCNKAKRDEVTKLKAHCSELEKESSHWRSRADEAQTQLKLNVSLSNDRQKNEDDGIDPAQVEELRDKLRQAEDEIERLDRSCTEVKERMVEMIQEHDQDKQDAIERCERALLQLHEDTKQALRDELESEHEQKMYELSVDHDAKIREISAELEQLQQELYDVKQSYVHVCSEKDSVRSSIQEQLLCEFETEKEALLSEHQEAIKGLENALEELESDMKEKVREEKEKNEKMWEKEREKMLNGAKMEWEKEKESEFTQRMETQIALAKVNWFEEFSASKQKAVHGAMKAEEDKWTARIDELKQEWEKLKDEETEKALKDAKEEWESRKNDEMRRLKDEFQSDKEAAIKMATCMAELNKSVHKEDREAEIEKRLSEMEDVWSRDKEDSMKKARDAWLRDQENLIRDAVEDTRKEMDAEMESEREVQRSLMEKALSEVKKVCDQDKQVAVKQRGLEAEKEIKKLQEQHRNDYEKFVEDHKKTLASFLEREKAYSRPKKICRDFSVQAKIPSTDDFVEKEKFWQNQKAELEMKARNDIAETEGKYKERLEELRIEMRGLREEKSGLESQLRSLKSQLEVDAERVGLAHEKQSWMLRAENDKLQARIDEMGTTVVNLKEQRKQDIHKLKERMREEYGRWKKERAALISKLKEASAQQSAKETETPDTGKCRFCQNSEDGNPQLIKHKDEATRLAIAKISEIYAGTLKLVKDEMMAFIGEARVRTKETISRERNNTAAKIKSHYDKTGQKSKPRKSVNDRDLQRLKVFESESDSRPDSPILKNTISQADSGKQISSEPPSLLRRATSDTRPKALLMERYLSENEITQYPTKLTPQSENVRHHVTDTTHRTPDLKIQDIATSGARGGVPKPYVLPQQNSPRQAMRNEGRGYDHGTRFVDGYRPGGSAFSPRRARSDVAIPEFSRIRSLLPNSNSSSMAGTYQPATDSR